MVNDKASGILTTAALAGALVCGAGTFARSAPAGETIQLTPAMLGGFKMAGNAVAVTTTIWHKHGRFATTLPDQNGCPGKAPPGVDLSAFDQRFLNSIVKLARGRAPNGSEVLVVLDYLVQDGVDAPVGPVKNPPELLYVAYYSRARLEYLVELRAGSYDENHLDEKVVTHQRQVLCESLSRSSSRLRELEEKSARAEGPASPALW